MRFSCAVLCVLILGNALGAQQKRVQEGNATDFDTPILRPLTGGKPCPGVRAPDLMDILLCLPRNPAGMANQWEIERSDYGFTAQKIAERINPPRFYPLVGRAQLHEVHWKCTVAYTEVTKTQFPFPFVVRRRRTEVVYIDKDHLHLVKAKK